jgi:hypothetical protein
MFDKKIQLIGLPRSGSSYFADAINRMIIAITLKNSYTVLWEPTQIHSNKEINYYYEAIKDKNVFVIKHHAIEFDRLVKHYGYNRLANRFYNIGLIRNNIFSLALSFSIATHTTQFRNYTYTIDDKITIGKKDFITCLHYQIQGWEAFVSNRNHYNEILYYRDLTFNPATDFNNLDLAIIKFNEVKLTDAEFQCLIDIETEPPAPDKFSVVTNYTELYNITLDFLSHYTHPLIEVTGVNFELRTPNTKTVANRVGPCAVNYRSD